MYSHSYRALSCPLAQHKVFLPPYNQLSSFPASPFSLSLSLTFQKHIFQIECPIPFQVPVPFHVLFAFLGMFFSPLAPFFFRWNSNYVSNPPPPSPPIPLAAFNFEKTSPRGLLHTYFPKSLIYLSFCAISIPCAFLFLCLFLNIAVINFCIFLVRIWVPLGKDKIAPTSAAVYIISSSWCIFSNFWTEQKGRRD